LEHPKPPVNGGIAATPGAPRAASDMIVPMRTPTLIAVLLLATVMCIAQPQAKEAVWPEGAAPAGPYTPGILANGILYVSGQVGRDARTGKIPENFEDEVAQTFENIRSIMRKAGYDFGDAVSVQVHLTDIGLFDRMNAVYVKHMPEPRPARTTVGGAQLVGKARIEITVTAYKPPARGGGRRK
jgi:2-iminobutanoate/2-iminopropanoate deaminase